MKQLVVATRNRGKLKEFEQLLSGMGFLLLSSADFPDLPDVVEDGETFEANAVKKARVAAQATGVMALADDSGLAVDALGGEPGVYSARYAGESATDEQNNMKLLQALANTPPSERSAAFHCVIALCCPDGRCESFKGTLSGVLLTEERGTEGFGYDPLFLVPAFDKTLAELSLDEKNQVSHRGRALNALKEYLAAGGSV
ncbi:XTP/dITP diphosphatase [Geobacter pickeringii]|uniref:dITP/XTP pyrophosphatase n=1 Tax=Geobacter pickeringii TaxID=345632 RepID=A0A0B5B9C4_9BACT|nr:XTP/dITP diphosphatase [Geobacter pickeringii]AJE03162.1 purine NTP phosphatase [Geobacter pickeringii]